ncbi:MAG: formimidoylglutamate deiminase [Gemmatimonadota bacterium]
MHGFSRPRLVFRGGAFEAAPPAQVGADPAARASSATPADLVLPGFVNAHSHAFQRVLRGRVEGRGDDFWGWRERMYRAALRLDPDDVRVASRAAFLEMALAGFTGVVEFHYLHHDPAGRPHDDPNAMAHAVLEAAAEVGLRICLLETAYARGGWKRDLDQAQRRFADGSVAAFVQRAEALREAIAGTPLATFGLALHSVRALPAEWLRELSAWGSAQSLPLHMHVAEQTGEVDACLAEHGRRPVELLADVGALRERFTAVHAIHLTPEEIELLVGSGARVCACPSTEANLADGFAPATSLVAAGVPLCLGTDSHSAIDPFSELRELDYRERLRFGRRVGVAPAGELIEIATAGGLAAAGWGADAGAAGDRVVLDGSHPALAGAPPDSVAEHLLVAGSPALVREVTVGGRTIVTEGRHPRQEEILRDFRALQARLWG